MKTGLATSKRSWNAQREHQQVSIRSGKPPPLQRDLCRGSPYVIPPGHLRPLQGASPNRLYALRYFSIPHVSKHFVELGEGRRGGNNVFTFSSMKLERVVRRVFIPSMLAGS